MPTRMLKPGNKGAQEMLHTRQHGDVEIADELDGRRESVVETLAFENGKKAFEDACFCNDLSVVGVNANDRPVAGPIEGGGAAIKGKQPGGIQRHCLLRSADGCL